MDPLFSQTESAIHEFRSTLPANSCTAQAIDRNDSWARIAALALNEGHLPFAGVLVEAYEKLLRQCDRPAAV